MDEQTLAAWNNIEKAKSEISLVEIQGLVEEAWAIRELAEEKEAELKSIKQNLSDAESRLKALMEESGVDTLTGESCVYAIKEERGIKAPQSVDGWTAFGEYIKEAHGEEVYKGMFRAHHGTAQSFIRKELEAQGQDFVIPGVPPVQPYTLLKAKKRKK